MATCVICFFSPISSEIVSETLASFRFVTILGSRWDQLRAEGENPYLPLFQNSVQRAEKRLGPKHSFKMRFEDSSESQLNYFDENGIVLRNDSLTVSDMENDKNVSVLVVAIEKLTGIAQQEFGGQSTDDLLKFRDGISMIYPYIHVGDCPSHLSKLPNGLDNGILILESIREKTDREYWFLGKAYEAKEEFQKSYEHFEKGIQYKPYEPSYVHEYVNSSIRIHKYLEAIVASTRLISSKPIDEIDDANYFDHCLCLYVNRSLVEAMEMINGRKWERAQYPRAVGLREKIIQLGKMIPAIGASIQHLTCQDIKSAQ